MMHNVPSVCPFMLDPLTSIIISHCIISSVRLSFASTPSFMYLIMTLGWCPFCILLKVLIFSLNFTIISWSCLAVIERSLFLVIKSGKYEVLDFSLNPCLTAACSPYKYNFIKLDNQGHFSFAFSPLQLPNLVGCNHSRHWHHKSSYQFIQNDDFLLIILIALCTLAVCPQLSQS